MHTLRFAHYKMKILLRCSSVVHKEFLKKLKSALDVSAWSPKKLLIFCASNFGILVLCGRVLLQWRTWTAREFFQNTWNSYVEMDLLGEQLDRFLSQYCFRFVNTFEMQYYWNYYFLFTFVLHRRWSEIRKHLKSGRSNTKSWRAFTSERRRNSTRIEPVLRRRRRRWKSAPTTR